jgi:hypothetical protein
MQKQRLKTMLTAFPMLKARICARKHTVNDKMYKDVIMGLTARVHSAA